MGQWIKHLALAAVAATGLTLGTFAVAPVSAAEPKESTTVRDGTSNT
jgi:hypothetical protein